jgi:precorrin-2/cobalt-factor-2 C20-methyltransferase
MSLVLSAVGVGPGDPELLTLKAARLIREADLIVAPTGADGGASLAHSIIADLIDSGRQQLLTRTFPMTRDPDRLAKAWHEVAVEVAGLVESGRKVVFVTLGDPSVYSTFTYLWQFLRDILPELQVEIVPGITSFTAAAAAAGVPLVCGSERMALAGADIDAEQLKRLLDDFDVVVLLKVARHFESLRAMLREVGLAARAVFVRRVGQAEETIITDLDRVRDSDLDYFSLLLVRS